MTPRACLYGIAALVAAAALGLVVGLRVGVGQSTGKVQALQIQAAEAKGSEDAAKHESQTHQQAADVYRVAAESAGDDVQRLRGEVERLRHAPAPDHHDQAPNDPQPVSPPVVLAPLVAEQDELIQAQGSKILALEGECKELRGVIESKDKALKLADLRADIQAQATKAALAGIKKSLWLGRAEGFAAGLAAGYAGGRSQR